MKTSNSAAKGKSETPFERFQNALRQVLSVSKSDLNQMLDNANKERRQHKGKPGPKPKHSQQSSASGHVSSDTD